MILPLSLAELLLDDASTALYPPILFLFRVLAAEEELKGVSKLDGAAVERAELLTTSLAV